MHDCAQSIVHDCAQAFMHNCAQALVHNYAQMCTILHNCAQLCTIVLASSIRCLSCLTCCLRRRCRLYATTFSLSVARRSPSSSTEPALHNAALAKLNSAPTAAQQSLALCLPVLCLTATAALKTCRLKCPWPPPPAVVAYREKVVAYRRQRRRRQHVRKDRHLIELANSEGRADVAVVHNCAQLCTVVQNCAQLCTVVHN